MDEPRDRFEYRSVWISDIHLGTRRCKARALLDFLGRIEAEYLYLVGDIFDCWQMSKNVYWPREHGQAVQQVLSMARTGTKVRYLPGNHDRAVREYVGMCLGGVEVTPQVIHRTADGRRLLTLHGDQFDVLVKYSRWLKAVGGWSYDTLVKLNCWSSAIRHRLGFPYWSLVSSVKTRLGEARKYKQRFEEAVIREAARQGVDGVVCGHIHWPERNEMSGIRYYNTGDWVESCTALVEDHAGHMVILEWPYVQREAFSEPELEEAEELAHAV